MATVQIVPLPEEVVIAAPTRLSALDVGELWAHRELIYFLTKRELQVRYKQSIFGVSWAVLQPLALAFVFAIFFGNILDIPSEGIPYAVFAVAGLVPWLFTAQAITNSATSLVNDANLISKVYFPRLALPISKALSLVIDLFISFSVVFVVTLLYGVSISANVWALPGFVALGLLTTFGLGTLLAAVNVRYRDVAVLVPMLVQVLFFITPVIYPGSLVTGDLEYLYALNPMVAVCDGVRWALYGTTFPGVGIIAISVGSALLVTAYGIYYFQKTERFFADVI
jgi:lipopolysaccharide transport system permease protein